MKTIFIHCKIGPHFVHRGFAEKIDAKIIKCCKNFGNINIITQIIESFFRGFFYSIKKYDIVICEGMEAIYLGVFIKLFSKNIKIIYHDADAFFYRDYKKFNGVKKKIIDYFLNKIDYIISDSKISKEYINKYLNKPTEVVYPYVDIEKFENIYKSKSTNKNIIYIGRFAQEKNIFELLKAFKKINLENSEIKLRLIGKGPLEDEIKNYITNQKISNIEIISRTNDLGFFLNDSYIGYNVSDFEPFGCNGLEYAISGVIPLLGIDNGNKEIFSNTDIITGKKYDDIYQKIKYFLNYDKNSYNNLLLNLKSNAVNYSKKNQLNDFEKKFYKLINYND